MRKGLFLIALLLSLPWLFFTTPTKAAYVTGQELSDSCQSGKNEDVRNCMYYIGGVVDYHLIMQSLGTAPTVSFCLPKNMPLEDLALVVMNYLKTTPEHGAFIAAPAVAMALNEMYPCVASGSRKKSK